MKEETLPGQEKRPALEAENSRLRRKVARLEQEREILKKDLGHFLEGTVSRFTFIEAQRG
ncbi:MAG: hypothetical protein J7M38_06740 [Armatimonadetes bacterium]|nr:hypothetical protein [Armatimonadota bacterium]